MPAHYSVIQYVPDPIADERINIGVVVVGELRRIHLRFLERWERVRHFGTNDHRSLREFARRVEIRQQELLRVNMAWTLEDLRSMSQEWIHSIQFTEPRASLKDDLSLLEEITTRFLVEPVSAAYDFRSRTTARELTARSVRSALRARLGAHVARDLVKKSYPLQGARSAHHFDVAAANGHPIFAAQTISLDQADQRHVERDINSAGWALHDVRQANPLFPTAIVTLFPQQGAIVAAEQQSNLERVRAISDELQVRLVPEAELDVWADQMAALVPLNQRH